VIGAPLIATVFPASAVSTSSRSSFFIPESFSGLALTCIATGWPRPSLEWRLGGVAVAKSNLSSSPTSVALSLFWEAKPVAGGHVTCVAMGTVNVSHTFRIDSLSEEQAALGELALPRCDAAGNETSLQLRVLELSSEVCSDAARSFALRAQVQQVILGVVESLCEGCGFIDTNVVLIEQISCGKEMRGVVFSGRVAMATTALTQEAACLLSEWSGSRPLVFLDKEFHELDSDCSLVVPDDAEAISGGRCASIRTSDPPQMSPNLVVAIAVPTGVGVVLILAVLLILLVVGSSKSKRNKSNGNSNKTATLQEHSFSEKL